MPLPEEILDELDARHRGERDQAERDKWRDLAWTGLQCLAWSFAGIALILWSAHTTSLAYGRMAFFAGVALGNGGIIFTLLAAHRRGERRGDW